MSVARHTEITAAGSSVEDAVDSGLARASKTLENIQQVWIKDISAKVDGSKVSEYRIEMKVSFVLKD